MKKVLVSSVFAVLVVLLVAIWTGRDRYVETQTTQDVSAQVKTNSISLNGDSWTLSFWRQGEKPVRNPESDAGIVKQSIKALVPGNVETDLLRAKLIANPEVGENSFSLRKYEGYQWQYSREFDSPKLENGQRAILRFEGIDCFADIFVNGKKIGESKNFFIPYSFDVTDALSESGKNKLDVIIRSSVIESSKYTFGMLGNFHVNNPDGEAVRKPAHCYGWDILPRIVSAGLWRGVHLDVQNPVRIEDANWWTQLINPKLSSARIMVDVKAAMPFELLDNAKIRATLSRNGKVMAECTEVLSDYNQRIRINSIKAELWWPRGYGEQPLYDAKIEIIDSNGKVIAADSRKFGIRKIELDYADRRLPDGKGEFCFKVNGEKIFVKGTNWVPVSALHGQDAKLLPPVLEMMKDLNCNMIRIWGGGVYESEEFYNYCDENGILVWQDFCFGCTQYPQNDEFAKLVEDEARTVVILLRKHPSLALWCGNNENDISLRWEIGIYNVDPNKDRISRQVLSRVLFEFDPTRPYLPSSPYVSQEAYDNPKSVFPTERHLWNSDNYFKIPYFTNTDAILSSEIGYHGCPNRSSLEKMMTAKNVYPFDSNFKFNDEWLAKGVKPFKHTTNPVLLARPNKFIKNSQAMFGEVYKDLDDFILASQSVQAEALKYFIELFRGQKFDKTGILWWNLRDGWPVLSDAVVDYYNSKKLAYHFIKNVQKDEVLLVNDANELIAVNDTLSEKSGRVKVSDIESGKILFEGEFKIPSNGKTLVAKLSQEADKGIFVIEYSIGNDARKNHYLYGKPPFDFKKYKAWLKKLGYETKR